MKVGGFSMVCHMKRVFLAVIFCGLPLLAHTGYGIIFDKQDNLYFTDIHNQVIWKLKPGGAPEALLLERWTHSLALDAQGNLFFDHEELQTGQWFTSLWKMAPSGELTEVVAKTINRRYFDGNAWSIDPSGGVFFFYERLPKSHYMVKLEEGKMIQVAGGRQGMADGVRGAARFSGVQAVIFHDDGRFYLTDGDRLRSINSEGIVTTIAKDLVLKDPPNPPGERGGPREINGLYGLAVQGEFFYVAYYGNSMVYKINRAGEASTFYQSEKTWSPVGVALDSKGVIHVLESVPRKGPKVTRVLANGKSETVALIELTQKDH